MLKLVIIDDEPSTRLGLKECFDWDQYDVSVVGMADDGETALPLIAELKPDIVLTDVKMPFLDGISLARMLKERNPSIKIVFISGYDNLEYLKFALKIEAIDYLLKPIDFQELDAVMRKVTATINGERSTEQFIQKMNAKLLQSMPLLKEKFWATLIRQQLPRPDWIQGQLSFLELDLPITDMYCVLVIKIDDFHSVYAQMPEREKQLSSFAVLNICQEIIDDTLSGYAFESEAGEYACILRIQDEFEEERLFQIVSEMKAALARIMKYSVTIGVGRTVPGLTQLAHSYQMASDAANLKLYLGKNQIITMDTLEPSQNYDIIMDAKESDKLVTLLKAADHIKIIHWLETLFMDITNRKRLNLNQCQRICLQILMSSSNVGMQLDLYTTHFPIEQENLIWEKLLRLETVDEMKQMLADHLGSLCSEINNKRNEKSSNVVELVKSIIHNNIHINWSLSEIASQIYLTSTYICILFKQETGDTINEYMTRVKMEKAKDMLQDHRFKLYEIGLAVGYTDSSYFAKLFKKYTGLAPSEYRNTIR